MKNYFTLPATAFKRMMAFCLLPVLSMSGQLHAACRNDFVSVQVLGSGGPELSDQRASSSYLVNIAGKAAIMVDSGSGSSLNYEKSGADLTQLQAVLFTHFHVDHSADFPALIKASYFTNRSQDLKIYGPKGNELMPSAAEFVNGLFGKKGVYRYLNDYLVPASSSAYHIRTENIRPIKNSVKQIQLTDAISLSAVPVHHGPIPALAWRIDAGGCAVTFSGDFNNSLRSVPVLAKNSDILVAHHAIPEGAQGIARNLHAPPSEIGMVAQQANVKKLVLSHRMRRTLGREQESLSWIRRNYSGPVIFANDLDVIDIE